MRKNIAHSEIGENVLTIKTWNPSQSTQMDSFSYIDLSSIDQREKKIVTTSTILLKDAPSRARQLVNKGDILVATVRPNLNGVAYVPKELDGATASTGFCVLRPNREKLNGRYLFHWVKLPQFVREMTRLATGANYPAVSDRIIKGSMLPLPSLPEQERIAAVLDKAEAIRQKRQQAIKFADDFLRATFHDIFGDPVTNPKGWVIKPAGELLTFLTSGSRGWAKYYSEDGALFLRIQNVGKNALILKDVARVDTPESAEARRTKVQPGDVLLSITADLGRTAVIPNGFHDAYINQHLAILRFAGVEPLYASAFLAYSGGQRQINRLNREGVKAGLNFENIRSFEIILPPTSLQKKWAKIYKKILKQNETLNNAIVIDGQLFNSLSQRAFRGEL